MLFPFRTLVVLVLIYVGTGTAWASKKVALVIGNSKYVHVAPLANPTNDADDISVSLEKIGFDVTKVKDLGYQQLRLTLRRFGKKALGSDIALVYYAGHGIEVDKNNYLIPTDAKLETDIDVEFEAMPLDIINRAVAGAKSLRLILLDACRDNPFTKSMARTISTRSIGRGLAKVEPTVGTLVSYAAKEGTVAADGKGRNSPYTKALMKHIDEQGLEIQFMFRKVRDSVITSTAGKQEPFTYGSLPGNRIFLNPVEKIPSGKPIVQAPKPRIDNTAEITFWDGIKNGDNRGYFKAYLNRYPKGIYSELAKIKIEEIKRAEEKATAKNVADRRKLEEERQIEELATQNAEKARQAEKAKRIAALAKEQEARVLAEKRLAELIAKQNQAKKVATEPEAKQIEQDKLKITALDREQPKPEVRAIDPVEKDPKKDRELVRSIQRELNRVGCQAGKVDGLWGKGSARALRNFRSHGKIELASLVPSGDLLKQLRTEKNRVCPLSCRKGFEVSKGQCKRIVKNVAVDPATKSKTAMRETAIVTGKSTQSKKSKATNKTTRSQSRTICFICALNESDGNQTSRYCTSDPVEAGSLGKWCKRIKKNASVNPKRKLNNKSAKNPKKPKRGAGKSCPAAKKRYHCASPHGIFTKCLTGIELADTRRSSTCKPV